MARAPKKRASRLPYVAQSQLTIEGFENPFVQHLSSKNRWVILANRIPWDSIVSVYNKQMRNDSTGASHINGRVVLGSLMIKHMCNLSDEETMLQIQENVYMQYFIGYNGFSLEPPFSSTLFVEIRKRLGVEEMNLINEQIVKLSSQLQNSIPVESEKRISENKGNGQGNDDTTGVNELVSETHKGKLLVDATACPQDIAYPTDLRILNDAREKSEQIIDCLCATSEVEITKPRTYRRKARKVYLRTAQKRNKTRKEIRISVKRQLQFLKRNINHIHKILDLQSTIRLPQKLHKYLLVIQDVYKQQNEMYQSRTHRVDNRIVSIHQPHVRPIVRGKEKAKVEFGTKIHISLINGFTFLDKLSWEPYNEGSLLTDSIEKYKRRSGVYPKEVLADKIYCTQENRRKLKELGIKLIAKPLGRPSAVNKEHVRPGERNPIEGKFGQAKSSYGMERIKARLKDTSESWVASIIMVLNLVKLAGQAPFSLILRWLQIYFFPDRVAKLAFTF